MTAGAAAGWVGQVVVGIGWDGRWRRSGVGWAFGLNGVRGARGDVVGCE